MTSLERARRVALSGWVGLAVALWAAVLFADLPGRVAVEFALLSWVTVAIAIILSVLVDA